MRPPMVRAAAVRLRQTEEEHFGVLITWQSDNVKLLLVADSSAIPVLQLVSIQVYSAASHLQPRVAIRLQGMVHRLAGFQNRGVQLRVLVDRYGAVASVR